jgi:hypothetical protein
VTIQRGKLCDENIMKASADLRCIRERHLSKLDSNVQRLPVV